MAFKLTKAPAVLQALVNDVLRDFLNVFVFIYLDDILIYSKDKELEDILIYSKDKDQHPKHQSRTSETLRGDRFVLTLIKLKL